MSIYRSTLILAALCAATLISRAQLRQVVVIGAASERVTEFTTLLQNAQPSSPDSLARLVSWWYARRGFLHAEVLSVDLPADSLRVTVSEGPVAIIESVAVRGLPPAEVAAFLGDLATRRGKVFTQARVEQEIEEVLEYLERSGRPLARVVVEDLRERTTGDTSWIHVVLGVDPGPVARIEEVRFTGNVSTRSSTLLTATGLRAGDVWLARTSDQVRRRLVRTQLFTSVGAPQLDFTVNQRAVVTVPVVEGRHNGFDGILGYQPAAAGGSAGIITGLINLQFRNLLGTGRRLAVRWFQERQGTHEVDLSYREPWLFGSQIAGGVEFHQRKQDSLYVRQRYAAEVRGDVDEDMTIGAVISRMTTTPQEGYGLRVMNRSTQTLAGMSFAYDTRDHPTTPRSGSLYATEYVTGRKSIGGPAGTAGHPTQRFRFDVGFYISPIRGQMGLIEAHWSEVRSGAIDAADLSRLGGATDLRGYREGEFLGSRLAWGTVEYRFFLAELSFVGVFVDAGSIRRPVIPAVGLDALDLLRMGAGMTIRVDSPVGLLGVSIAMGKGDGFADAKLHVRIQNEF